MADERRVVSGHVLEEDVDQQIQVSGVALQDFEMVQKGDTGVPGIASDVHDLEENDGKYLLLDNLLLLLSYA